MIYPLQISRSQRESCEFCKFPALPEKSISLRQSWLQLTANAESWIHGSLAFSILLSYIFKISHNKVLKNNIYLPPLKSILKDYFSQLHINLSVTQVTINQPCLRKITYHFSVPFGYPSQLFFIKCSSHSLIHSSCSQISL